MKLTKKQRQVLADVFVNLATAWISIGTISQLVFKIENLSMLFISLLSFLILVWLSTFIVK